MVETMPDVHPEIDEQDDHDGFGNGGKSEHPDSRPGVFRPLEHECHEDARREQDHKIETGQGKVELGMESTVILTGEKGDDALEEPEQKAADNGCAV